MTAMSELVLILVVTVLSYLLGSLRTYRFCKGHQDRAIKAQDAAIESLRRSTAREG